jgi:hypothetical protein
MQPLAGVFLATRQRQSAADNRVIQSKWYAKSAAKTPCISTLSATTTRTVSAGSGVIAGTLVASLVGEMF